MRPADWLFCGALAVLAAANLPKLFAGRRPAPAPAPPSLSLCLSLYLEETDVTTLAPGQSKLLALSAYQGPTNGPGSLAGAPGWASSDPAVLSVTPTADGLHASVLGVSAGAATVTATAAVASGPSLSASAEFLVAYPPADRLVIGVTDPQP